MEATDPIREPNIAVQGASFSVVAGDCIDQSTTVNMTNIHLAPSNDFRPQSTSFLASLLALCVSVACADEKAASLGLEEHISRGAARDSYERPGLDVPKCHPETGATIQEEVMS